MVKAFALCLNPYCILNSRQLDRNHTRRPLREYDSNRTNIDGSIWFCDGFAICGAVANFQIDDISIRQKPYRAIIDPNRRNLWENASNRTLIDQLKSSVDGFEVCVVVANFQIDGKSMVLTFINIMQFKLVNELILCCIFFLWRYTNDQSALASIFWDIKYGHKLTAVPPLAKLSNCFVMIDSFKIDKRLLT